MIVWLYYKQAGTMLDVKKQTRFKALCLKPLGLCYDINHIAFMFVLDG